MADRIHDASDAAAAAFTHEHHLWRVERVRALAADQNQAATCCCGGARNRHAFVDVIDVVFVLEVDIETLARRRDERRGERGSRPAERELTMRLHRTREDVPADAVLIDARPPLGRVVDEILRHALGDRGPTTPPYSPSTFLGE